MTKDSIRAVKAEIFDIPIRRPHHFAALTITKQSLLLVRVQTEDGLEGIGESVTPGGPWWGGESVESMKATVDGYLAPCLVGEDYREIEPLRRKMRRMVAGTPFAKAAVEIALFDVWAKARGVPLHELLGGLCRRSLPTAWALANADMDKDAEEAAAMRERHGFHRFKVKVGASDPRTDVARIGRTIRAMGADDSVRLDFNEAWDEPTATRWLPALEEAGVDLVEQPIARWNLAGMARLAERLAIPLMADESIWSIQDALEIARLAAADVLALKIFKTGGLLEVRKIAAIAEAAGILCYGGSTLESSVGMAASVQLYCTIPNLTAGCELFGPLWLADDIVETSVEVRDGQVWLPEGNGIGVKLDEDKVERYRRR